MAQSGWQRHSCRPNDTYPHVELGGQKDSRVIEGYLYFFDHRREYANTRNITPRTYIITEGPEGQLSGLAGWHAGNRAYTRYTISAAYDVQNYIGTFCWYIDYDVEDSCVFSNN